MIPYQVNAKLADAFCRLIHELPAEEVLVHGEGKQPIKQWAQNKAKAKDGMWHCERIALQCEVCDGFVYADEVTLTFAHFYVKVKESRETKQQHSQLFAVSKEEENQLPTRFAVEF